MTRKDSGSSHSPASTTGRRLHTARPVQMPLDPVMRHTRLAMSAARGVARASDEATREAASQRVCKHLLALLAVPGCDAQMPDRNPDGSGHETRAKGSRLALVDSRRANRPPVDPAVCSGDADALISRVAGMPVGVETPAQAWQRCRGRNTNRLMTRQSAGRSPATRSSARAEGADRSGTERSGTAHRPGQTSHERNPAEALQSGPGGRRQWAAPGQGRAASGDDQRMAGRVACANAGTTTGRGVRPDDAHVAAGAVGSLSEHPVQVSLALF